MDHFTRMLNFYAQHHQKKITKLTHFIGVPMVFFAIQIFLNLFSSLHLTYAWLLFMALICYYSFLNIRLALMTGLLLFIMTYLAQILVYQLTHFISIMISLGLFVLGWAIQFIGHYYEGKPPAFLKNIFQMLIAPLFLMQEVCLAFGFNIK